MGRQKSFSKNDWVICPADRVRLVLLVRHAQRDCLVPDLHIGTFLVFLSFAKVMQSTLRCDAEDDASTKEALRAALDKPMGDLGIKPPSA